MEIFFEFGNIKTEKLFKKKLQHLIKIYAQIGTITNVQTFNKKYNGGEKISDVEVAQILYKHV